MGRFGALLFAGAIGCAVACTSAKGPDADRKTEAPSGSHAVVPDRKAWSEAQVSQLALPAGFEVKAFATGLGNVRNLAVADNGDIYITRRAENDVMLLRDRDGDAKAEERRIVASGIYQINGITLWQK